MDLNELLLWIVGLSSGLGLLVHGIRFRFRAPGWTVVFALLLIVVLVGSLVWREQAGLVAGALWIPFVLIPSLGIRQVSHLVTREKYAWALFLSRLLAALHPFDGWGNLHRFVWVVARIREGDLDPAREQLPELWRENPSLARFVTLQLLRAEGRWQELGQWVEEHIEPRELALDPSSLAVYLRSFGEAGDIERMLHLYESSRGNQSADVKSLLQLFVAGFTGNQRLTESALSGPHRRLPDDMKSYWRATARQAAGDTDEAAPLLEELRRLEDPLLGRASEQRLAQPLPRFDPEQLTPSAREILRRFAAEAAGELRFGPAAARRRPVVVVTLMLLNIGVFLLELPGGATNTSNLVELGALVDPPELVPGGWWRIFSAGFLHYGWVHLGLNMLGLWVLGRYGESVWGRWRLLCVYLAATLGANAIAILVLSGTSEYPKIIVGASGGIMGIFGAALAFMGLGWQRYRLGVLRRQFGFLMLLLCLQIVYDHYHPQVSSTVHMAGLAIGLLVGGALFLLGPRSSAAPAS